VDATLTLIGLCERVIDAGTTAPGEWAKAQRPLMELCRGLLNDIGDRRMTETDALDSAAGLGPKHLIAVESRPEER
jgi:hypothetical protein